MSGRDQDDLGRCEGMFVPVDDVQAHENAGWQIVIGAVYETAGHDGRVLMRPPADWGAGE